MIFTPTAIPDVIVIEPKVFGDDRGFFFESFNEREFTAAVGRKIEFVQDNHSLSQRGVIRGLHYQLPPYDQGKLVRVISGAVFDVAVDIRKSSPTFGRWTGMILSASNKLQLWIPPGFAHGFMATTENAEFLYKTTNFYMPATEKCIIWNDNSIGISWPIVDKISISQKDANGLSLLASTLFS
jgi:dTDP-4-dehydrorhamnose 3,5-epimerase